jgi:MFS family permease
VNEDKDKPSLTPSRLRVAGVSLVCGICGFVLGFMLSMLLAQYIFYTTKALALMNTSWVLACAIAIALGFAAFPLATRIRHVPPRRAARAALSGIVAALITAVVVALAFASAHRHYIEVQRVGGDFFALIGPLLFAIPLVGVITSLILLFRHTHEQSTGNAQPP